MKRGIVIFAIVVLDSVPGFAGHDHPERWYQAQWCGRHGGKMEVVLSDRSRCDCETETHAVEFDFAEKWAEAIGQALHYAQMSGKRAGIVLIIESEKDFKYWIRLTGTVRRFNLPINIWRVGYVFEKEKICK